MTIAAIITICITVIAVILFVSELLSIDLIALLIIVSLVLTGVITPDQGLQGFSNKATVTVMFMFVLSAALLKTGVMQILAQRLADTFRYNFNLGMFLLMVVVATISAFINNTPVVAVFLPVVVEIAKKSGRSVSKMLIPLSFASILGGTCTLVGSSSNILVSGIAEQNGLEPFGFFYITPFGLIGLVAGLLFMNFIGIKLLPDRSKDTRMEESYNLRNYIAQFKLKPNSSSVGETIGSCPIIQELDIKVLEVLRGKKSHSKPDDNFQLEAKDILKVKGDIEQLKKLDDKSGFEVYSKKTEELLKNTNAVWVELIIPTNSPIEGNSIAKINFAERFKAVPRAIRSQEFVHNQQLRKFKLNSGDMILAQVAEEDMDFVRSLDQRQNPPFLLLSEINLTPFNLKNFLIVLITALGMIVLASFGVFHIVIGAMLSTIIFVLTGVIKMSDAYDSINWKVIFLLAGALSLGVAIQNVELDLLIATSVANNLGHFGPIIVLSALYLITSLFTEVMSNNAVAALITPIAIAIATGLGVSPYPFLIVVVFACSAAFISPVGYQTNTMVYGVGNYKFVDFVKTGIGLKILLWILATIFIHMIYPF